MREELLETLREFERYLATENDLRVQAAYKTTVATREALVNRGVRMMSPVIPNLLESNLDTFAEWLQQQEQVRANASPISKLATPEGRKGN